MRSVGVTGKPARSPAGRDNLRKRPFYRRYNIGVVRIAQMPHRLRQVAGRDEEYVNMIDGQNLSQVVDRNDVFDQDNDQRLVVGPVYIVRDAVSLAARVHAPPAGRMELGRVDHRLGLFDRIDMGTTSPCAPKSNVR